MTYQLDAIARLGDLFVVEEGFLSVVHKYGANAFKIVEGGYEFLGTHGEDLDLSDLQHIEGFARNQIEEFRNVLNRLEGNAQ